MNPSRPTFDYDRCIARKAMLFTTIVLLCALSATAQNKSNLKGTIGGGFLIKSDSDNMGVFFNAEPKLSISKKAHIGLRIGMALNPQKFDVRDPENFSIDELSDNGGISCVPTIDYYLGESKVKPYVGTGIGAYLLSSSIDISQRITNNPSEREVEARVNYQFGVLFRSGIESGKTRLGLEYNLIQKADIELPNGQIIGTVDNSYLGLSIGYIFGT